MCPAPASRACSSAIAWRTWRMIPKAEGETIAPKKPFKDYEPGFVHIDIKYVSQMPDETSRRYLFVAIGRATRWVFMHIYSDMTQTSSVVFRSGSCYSSCAKYRIVASSRAR